MKHVLLFIVVLTIFSTACSDYSDHQVVINQIGTNSLFDAVTIEIGVQGKEELTYAAEISYKDKIISQSSVTSNFKPTKSLFNLDFSRLDDKAIDFAHDLIENQRIEFRLLLINESQKMLIDTTIYADFYMPPIARVLSADMSHGMNDISSPLQSSLIESRKLHPNLDETKSHRVAFLSELLKNNQKGIHIKSRVNKLTPVKKGFKIDTRLITDTVFQYTVIGRYPAHTNNYYDEIDLDNIIKEYIDSNLDSIKSDWKGKRVNSDFIIEDKVSSEYAGLIGIYLINIDDIGQFTFQQVGSYLSDAVSPKFSHSSYCSEPRNPEYEGTVCIDSKNFYGWSPYNVPFVGRAYGDIKAIYVDNMRVKFELGEEIYFKKKVYLDGGYNRVPVKIIDNSGNVTESFIPITIKDLDNNDVNIDNNINIENY